MTIVIATHVTFVNGRPYVGPVTPVVSSLTEDKADFVLLQYSIDGRAPAYAHVYQGGVEVETRVLRLLSTRAPVRYVAEVLATALFVIRHVPTASTFIGVDPLNALAGALLRYLGRVDTSVFYSADFSEGRFERRWASRTYVAIDDLMAKVNSVTWSVSTRIVEKRARSGLSDQKNIFVPNVPHVNTNLYKPVRQTKAVVTLGMLSEQQDYIGLIRAVVSLHAEDSEVSLTIVGNGPHEDALHDEIAQLNATRYIKMTGRLTHAEALGIIQSSGVGGAVYSGQWAFNYYGDSMKCREYAKFGLPILTTDTHSTVEEIRGMRAGVVCEQTSDAYVTGLRKIFESYDEMASASLALGVKYNGIHKRLLNTLNNK